MGLPTVGGNLSLTARVLQYLKDEERILSSLTPKVILNRVFGRGETEKSLQEVYDVFLKTPGLPCLESEKVLLDAARQGITSGLLGARLDSAVYFGETPPALSLDTVIMRPEKAELAKKSNAGTLSGAAGGSSGEPAGYSASGAGRQKANGKEGDEDYSVRGSRIEPSGGVSISGPAAGAKVRQISIRASVPWDKLSQIVSGVIQPLKHCGADPEIVIEIKAKTETGFDRNTLDVKVKETFQQLGSRVVEWEEDPV